MTTEIREEALKAAMFGEQPTLREVMEGKAAFACPHCGELTQIDNTVNLYQVDTVTIDADCCEYEETFDGNDPHQKIPKTVADYDVLTDISGVGKNKAAVLIDAGYRSKADIQRASQQELASINGIGNALAARIKADVGDIDTEVSTKAAETGEDGSCPVDGCPVDPNDLYTHMIDAHGWYAEHLEDEFDG